MYLDPVDVIECLNLHGFCDIGTQVYCAAVYVQTISGDGVISHIIAAKTKVAQIKELSVPRLELLSCVLLAELMSAVCRSLKYVVSIINQKFLYSDSEVALTWIKGKIKQWKPWVQNTLNKIKKMPNEADWFYVKTSSNPADVETCVNSVITFPRNELWWYGPSFLRGNDVLDQVKSNVTVDGDINESLTQTNETFPRNRHGIGGH